MESLGREDRKLLEYTQRQHAEGKISDEELSATMADIMANPTLTPPRPLWKKRLGWGMITFGIIILGWLGYRIVDAAIVPRFEKVANACELATLLVVSDDGKSLMIQGGGEERSAYDIDDIVCVLRETEAPTHVIQHMSSTRAIDGQQVADWDGITARWSFHPDPGFNLILVEN